jgi:hypothetical protein
MAGWDDVLYQPLGGRVNPLSRDELGNPLMVDAAGNNWHLQPAQRRPQAPPRPAEQGFWHTLGDNVIGFDDGVQSPGEAVGQALNALPGTAAQALWDSIAAPGRAARGEPMTTEAPIAMAMDWGSAGVGAAAALPSPEGAVGIFAGRRAQTANQNEMMRAMAYESMDRTPEQIHRETNWFRGADGQWRFEIDDSQARIRPEMFREGVPENLTVGQFMDHEALFEAYPNLRDLPMEFRRNADGSHGFLQPTADERGAALLNVSPDADNQLSTTLHELQHAVQYREGFAPGSSTLRSIQPELRDNLAQHEELVNQGAWDDMANLEQQPEFAERYADANPMEALTSPEAGEILDRNPLFRQAVLNFADRQELLQRGYRNYRNSMGEVEARVVQERQRLTPYERQLMPPMRSREAQQHPPSQQINPRDFPWLGITFDQLP